MWLHLLPGRGRVRVPGLRGDERLARLLEQRLGALPGVRGATASALTGSLLIHFDPAQLSPEYLEQLLLSPHHAEVAAAAEPVPPIAEEPDPPEGGLTTAEVERRRALVGTNVLMASPGPSFWQRFLSQYKDVMQLTLVGGMGLSFLSGHRRDAFTIGALLLVNGLIGASQSGGGSNSVAALRSLGGQSARVLRDGIDQRVPAADLVPGDHLVLEAGDLIPADAELVAGVAVATDERLLTGECAPVEKHAEARQLHAGTLLVRGRGMAVVTATGMSSTLGRVASLMEREERPSPVQQDLDRLGRRITKGGLWLAAGVTAVALLRGTPLIGALIAGVSLAISAIPEGLPSFVAMALASGARRMSERNGSFRNLAAVEQMGAVTTLCLDKTGTLTQGQMCLTEIRLPTGVWSVSGEGYSPVGTFRKRGAKDDPLADRTMRRFLQVGALCNNGRIGLDEQGALVTDGDPTEVALLVCALKAGLRACGGEGDRVLENPFDSDRRRMSVVCRDGTGHALSCVKGAPESLLPRCSRLFLGDRTERMDQKQRRTIARQAAEMASRGLRVLCLAYRPVPDSTTAAEAEEALIYLGLAGIADPPRPEAAEAIQRCRTAGVQVVMITGDHPATATAVAKQIGLFTAEAILLTGAQLAQMSETEMAEAVKRVAIVARATPEQKLRVIQALRRTGQVVAMTGDGVNDGPAMREADVGIAMGDGGTELAKATASLVLEDDNLLGILDAFEQGRMTRGNIRRTATYLLGSNAAEVCLMAASLLLGLPLPLLPVQLLWTNLVGDALPATALGAQGPEPGLMQRPPDRTAGLLPDGSGRRVLGHGLRTGILATGLYAWALATGRPVAQARTLAMVTLAASQIRHLRAVRSRGDATQVRRAGLAAAALTLGAVYLPPLRRPLQLMPLGVTQLALAAGVGMAT